MQQPSFYGSGYPPLNFDVSTALSFASLPGSQGTLQGVDLNSPEVFKQNIQLVQGHIARVQSLARSALSGM